MTKMLHASRFGTKMRIPDLSFAGACYTWNGDTVQLIINASVLPIRGPTRLISVKVSGPQLSRTATHSSQRDNRGLADNVLARSTNRALSDFGLTTRQVWSTESGM